MCYYALYIAFLQVVPQVRSETLHRFLYRIVLIIQLILVRADPYQLWQSTQDKILLSISEITVINVTIYIKLDVIALDKQRSLLVLEYVCLAV